jgi:diaminohydroxyphosphoribosylaminopyrimidine deaminase / 5-amino-6-(5-phosphoribosylamino)uracil reductase
MTSAQGAGEPSPFMRAALEAARRARGNTSPNPWVGAVVVRDGEVISTGVTSPPGGPHAEAAALAGVDARGADVYTTLEPCSPFEGKRTPPCSAALVAAGVKRVVVAIPDPDPQVSGRGLAIMREAGLEVEVGDGAAAAADLLRPYLKHRRTGLPYVIAKYAASLDGRTATGSGDSKWITGDAARDRGHEQRAWVDAVMVGSGTVLADDPALTARPGGALAPRQPVRVVVDSRGRTPLDARLFKEPGHVIVATTMASDTQWRAGVAAAGAQMVLCEAEESGLNLTQLMGTLGQRGILSVWAEGGSEVLGSLFAEDLVDEVWAFLAPKLLGADGRPAVAVRGPGLVQDAWTLEGVEVERLGDDVLVRGYVGGHAGG